MLLAIRERVMGVVGWFILGILFIAFAFFGLNSYLDGDVASYVASVNGVEISEKQENIVYQRLKQRLENRMGSSLDPNMIDETKIRKSALRQLIDEELLFQEATAGNFSANDQQLAAQISAVQMFKKDGKFSRQRYEKTLSRQGMTSSGFEGQLRRGMMIDQLRLGILKTAAPTPGELLQAYRLQGQQRRFSYLILPLSDFDGQVTVSDHDIEQHYDTHGQEYMSHEQVKVQYLELEAAKLKTGTEPDKAALLSLYEEESGRFTTEEERKARHILVMFQGTDEENRKEAASKAEKILKRLDDGEDFDALAREVSEDPGSASSGGDLGFFGRGIMAAAFEEAVFTMQVGERSDPVSSPYGLHIIELIEVKPEIVKPFEDVREQLVDQMLSEERGDAYFEQSEVLASMAFEHPDTLQEAASVLGIEIQESDWLTAEGGEGVGEHAAIAEAAFSDDVLLGGNNSNVIEIGDNHIIVLRVSEHQKAAQKPVDDVRDIIREHLQDEKTRSLVKEKGENLLANLRAGAKLEEAASEQGFEAGKTGLIRRAATTPQTSLVHQAFSLSTPEEGETGTGGFVMSDGAYALVQLEEVKDGQFDSLNASARIRVWQELAKVYGNTEIFAVIAALNERAAIYIPGNEAQ